MTTRSFLTIAAVLLAVLSVRAQKNEYDLVQMAQTGRLDVRNRNLILLSGEKQKGVHLDAREGDGVAWLNGVRFSNGTIELDIRGKDLIQQSFVGIAFHGMSRDSLEALYFRPFNFRSNDSAKRSHAVEYICGPDFPWERLRKEHPGIFEKGIDPPPLPDEWFHVRIVLHFPDVKVYVANSSVPCLSVRELSTHADGKIGLWVGNHSDGDFANLTISAQ